MGISSSRARASFSGSMLVFGGVIHGKDISQSYQPGASHWENLIHSCNLQLSCGEKNSKPGYPFYFKQSLKKPTVQQNSEGNSMNYWLVNRDPYFMVYYKLYLAE